MSVQEVDQREERDRGRAAFRKVVIKRVLPSDFQVADTEVNRLPTLKELIGYRTNNYSTGSTPVFLNLLPLSDDPPRVKEPAMSGQRDKIFNATNVTRWTERVLAKGRDYPFQDRLYPLSGNNVDAYYAENNIAVDENDASFTYKKRFDRDDSSTTTLRPTTLRGIPLTDLLPSQTLRGFYVTMSETSYGKSNETKKDTFDVGTASPLTVDKMAISLEQGAEQRQKNSNGSVTTFKPDSVVDGVKDENFEKMSSLQEGLTTLSSLIENQDTMGTIGNTEPTQRTTTDLSLHSGNVNATRSHVYDDEVNVTKFGAVHPLETGKSAVSTTSAPTTTEYTKTPIVQPKTVENNVDGRQRNVEFGRRSQRRGQTRFVRPTSETRTESVKEVQNTRYPRRRVVTYTRKYREPRPFEQLGRNGKVKEIRVNSYTENQNNEEGRLIEEETNASSTVLPKTSRTSNDAVFVEESLRIDGVKTEEKSSTNTVTPRALGNLAPTRLRKPAAFALTTSQNKSPDEVANRQKTRPTDGNVTLINEKVGAIDQSGRAQEVAVTLADPPSQQSPVTGRSSFRNGVRRKISTTVAPRTDTTTNRTTLRLPSILRDRQGPTVKDKPLRNVTSRPRRPPVIDYDYYEDEEEPVVGKSTYNEKLFLTSTGSFRCLDQGNFPHPYSCKKFITCAKMVNGFVIGAEYTCPNKLSFDPVGGICNWSAGLGCKD